MNKLAMNKKRKNIKKEQLSQQVSHPSSSSLQNTYVMLMFLEDNISTITLGKGLYLQDHDICVKDFFNKHFDKHQLDNNGYSAKILLLDNTLTVFSINHTHFWIFSKQKRLFTLTSHFLFMNDGLLECKFGDLITDNRCTLYLSKNK